MSQPVLPGLVPMCERRPVHTKVIATSIVERECPHCNRRDVLYVCDECAKYIKSRIEAESGGNWRCVHCGLSRPFNNGYRILGKA